MKMGSKYVLTTLILSFLLMMTTAYAADTKKYYLTESGINVSVPADLIVFTQDIATGDPNLALLNTDEKTLETYFSENSIYLNAMPQDRSYEILLTISSDENTQQMINFIKLTDEEILNFGESIEQLYTGYGFTFTGSEVISQRRAKFIQTSFEQTSKDSEAYISQCYTVNDGVGITITMHSISKQSIENNKALFTDIVKSFAYKRPFFSQLRMINILSCFLITAFLCLVPMTIYRLLIKNESIQRKRAMYIVLLDGAIIYLVVTALIFSANSLIGAGAAALIFSIVNYLILTSGRAKQAALESIDEESLYHKIAVEMRKNNRLEDDPEVEIDPELIDETTIVDTSDIEDDTL